MAEVTKYQLIPNNNIISDFKTHFSVFKTRKSSSFIYGVVLIFVLFSVFLAFSPSSSSTSPWFVNVFAVNSTSPTNQVDRSHFSTVYSYFFPNSTQITSSRSQINATSQIPMSNNSQNLNNTQFSSTNNTTIIPTKTHSFSPQISKNLNNTQLSSDKDTNSEQNNTTIIPTKTQTNQSSSFSPQISQNHTVINPEKQINQTSSNILPQISPLQKNQSSETIPHSSILPDNQNSVHQSDNEVLHKEKQNNQSRSDNTTITPQVPANSTKKLSGVGVNSDLVTSLSKNQGKSHENEVENLVGCDLYDGGWVKDESYPLYKPGSCKLVDEQFNCFLNGRPDNDYYKLKWKPKGCSIPRLNGGCMLELLRGKRLVFVGDSLNRNMWESLVCILKNSVKDKTKVYEAFGRHHFRTEASYSFVFKDYNCTVEFFVSPFLVQQWEIKDKSGTTQETLRLDLIVSDADQFKGADFLIFNTGHWWTHDKTSKGEGYYQEGSHVYKQLDVNEAFRRAITTWGRWVDANIDPRRTHVLFRGYSASHFSGGQWNSGGQCDSETEPIRNDTYLTEYPLKMKVFESVIKSMKTHVSYLNVTRLTDYRKDGHPSVFRKQHLSGDEKKSPLRYQDCSHWCLPGVPDSWNELLYAELLRKQHLDEPQKNRT